MRRRCALVATLLAMCAAALAGAALASNAARDALAVSVPLDSPRPLVCEGRVAGDAVGMNWGWRFDLDLVSCDGADASGRVRASAAYRYSVDSPEPNDLIRAPFAIKRPREFARRGSFSYHRYLLSRGIGAVAYARGDIEIVHRAGGFGATMGRMRDDIVRMIRSRVPPREGEIVEALATGRRAGMDDGVRESFARAGIAHLLAISGLHVGYVALMIYILLRATLGRAPSLISRVPLPRLAALIALPLVWLYVSFVGFPMSGVRAGLMISIYFVGVIAGLRQDLPTTLAAAVIAILVVWPLAVLDISFQLSVAAVMGIIVAALPSIRWADARLSGKGIGRWLVRRAAALVAISIAAGLFTAPLVAYHFGTYTMLGPVTNMVAVPLVALGLMPAVLAATTLAPIAPWAAKPLFVLSGFLSRALIDTAEIVRDLGSALTGDISPTPLEMALAYAAIVLLVALAAFRRTLYRLIFGWATKDFTDP